MQCYRPVATSATTPPPAAGPDLPLTPFAGTTAAGAAWTAPGPANTSSTPAEATDGSAPATTSGDIVSGTGNGAPAWTTDRSWSGAPLPGTTGFDTRAADPRTPGFASSPAMSAAVAGGATVPGAVPPGEGLPGSFTSGLAGRIACSLLANLPWLLLWWMIVRFRLPFPVTFLLVAGYLVLYKPIMWSLLSTRGRL